MKQLQSLSIVSPGWFGVNTQESSLTLSPNYAEKAENAVIDKYGRIGARKGWVLETIPNTYYVDSLALELAFLQIYLNKETKDVVLEAFLRETVGGFARGDSNNNGVAFDLSDVLNILKYYLGTLTDPVVLAWVQDNIITPMETDYNSVSPVYNFDSSYFTPSNGAASGFVRFMLEHVNADNTKTVLSGFSNLIVKDGVGSTNFTDITPSLYTITDNDWSGACLNDVSLLVQEGHEPLAYSEGVCATMTDYLATLGVTATQSYGTNYPHHIITGYGRFWAHDKKNIYWSTDIADGGFPSFSGGSSGFLNIASVLPNNVDNITGLAVHNNLLVILCENNVVIYSGADNPIGSNFALYDVIPGVGCIARDSIQNTGNDLLFLSQSGLRSFGRLVQEKSLPLRDLSKNIRDDLIETMRQEVLAYDSLDHVKSVYSEKEAFYLLSFPHAGIVYCFDMRGVMEDGAARVTTWLTPIYSFLRRINKDVLLGKDGVIGRYYGYTDNTDSYTLSYASSFVDFGSPSTLKILKNISFNVFGGYGQEMLLYINTDFETDSSPYIISIAGGVVAEFGVSEYNTSAEFNLGQINDKIKIPINSSGNLVQMALDIPINNELSLQKIDIFVKTGKVN